MFLSSWTFHNICLMWCPEPWCLISIANFTSRSNQISLHSINDNFEELQNCIFILTRSTKGHSEFSLLIPYYWRRTLSIHLHWKNLCSWPKTFVAVWYLHWEWVSHVLVPVVTVVEEFAVQSELYSHYWVSCSCPDYDSLTASIIISQISISQQHILSLYVLPDYHYQTQETGIVSSYFMMMIRFLSMTSRTCGRLWLRGAQGFQMFPESKILQTLTFTVSL